MPGHWPEGGGGAGSLAAGNCDPLRDTVEGGGLGVIGDGACVPATAGPPDDPPSIRIIQARTLPGTAGEGMPGGDGVPPMPVGYEAGGGGVLGGGGTKLEGGTGAEGTTEARDPDSRAG